MKHLINLTFLSLIITLVSCDGGTQTEQAESAEPYGNPAAAGFNEAGSDAKAIDIADEVMEANGGREAWDNTRYICWSFFGRDNLVWDKWSGNVRIDTGSGMTLLTNINDETGRAFMGEREITDADTLGTMMQQAKSIWINHSYWLVMPYKLKDSGVTLTYAGEEATQDGRMADKLNLTFEGVGRTPQNMYYVWVDKESRLVTQWAYYPTAEAEEPRFVNPWADYQQYGKIMLSGSRGERGMEDIMVFDELPETVFTSAEKPDLKAMMEE
jgi:plasmid maintenance system killer protein